MAKTRSNKGKMTTPISILAGAFIEGVSLALAIYWEWKKGKE